MMSTPSIAPKIIICRDPAAAARPQQQPAGGKQAAAGGASSGGVEPPSGWGKKPSRHEEARYAVDRQGTAKRITTAELEAISAAIAAADAQVFDEASAPPMPAVGAEGGSEPGKVGWL